MIKINCFVYAMPLKELLENLVIAFVTTFSASYVLFSLPLVIVNIELRNFDNEESKNLYSIPACVSPTFQVK